MRGPVRHTVVTDAKPSSVSMRGGRDPLRPSAVASSIAEMAQQASSISPVVYARLQLRSEWALVWASGFSAERCTLALLTELAYLNALAAGDDGVDRLLATVGQNRRSLGVSRTDHVVLYDILVEVIAETLGDRFDHQLEAAWRTLVDQALVELRID